MGMTFNELMELERAKPIEIMTEHELNAWLLAVRPIPVYLNWLGTMIRLGPSRKDAGAEAQIKANKAESTKHNKKPLRPKPLKHLPLGVMAKSRRSCVYQSSNLLEALPSKGYATIICFHLDHPLKEIFSRIVVHAIGTQMEEVFVRRCATVQKMDSIDAARAWILAEFRRVTGKTANLVIDASTYPSYRAVA